MKFCTPLVAASLVAATRVVAFSPPVIQHRRAAVLSSALARDTDNHIAESSTSSAKTNDSAGRVAGMIEVRPETGTERAVSLPSETKENSIENFVADMRNLYRDLENGGGFIKVRMANVGVSFTYVAPSISSSTSETNTQLNGKWRRQMPTRYDSTNIAWNEIHADIAETQSCSGTKAPPMLIYLPGLDGFGISATSQFDDLASTFELWRMTVDKSTAQPTFAQLVSAVVNFVQESTKNADDSPREVILVGESFGGLLTCAVAMALKNVKSNKFLLKGMTLVNPATSFDETNWEQFVPLLTSLRYLETQDEIVDDRGNFNFVTQLPTPYSVLGGVALAATIPDGKQFSSILEFILGTARVSSNEQMLAASADGFRLLAEYLPATTLETRVLKWLPVGTSVINNRLSKLALPTLVIAGNDDNMLPTKEEANRLGKLLPNCVKMDVSGAGHFVLDGRVNLTEVLVDSHIDPLNIKMNSPPYDPVRDWKLPPDDVVRAVVEKRVKPTRRRTSPVFFSTDSVTGERRLGLSLVPTTNDRPLLIVGNHQLFGQDLGMIISELLEERNIVARGLAHPTVAEGLLLLGEQEVRTQRRRFEFSEDIRFEGDLFQMFGAVKVSPRNFFRLLQSNQTALLFPGGVREALHGKEEDYKLFWPEKKTDFVRIAAKFNATIVPLSAIGSADSVNIVADAEELLNLPFGIGENLSNFSKSTVSARFDAKDEDEIFIPPLAVPKPFPARHFFLFGRSFDTTLLDPNDKEECQRMYFRVKDEVQQGIDALLIARKNDPYALDGVKRDLYQRLFGKAPPTFPLSSLSKSTNSL